MMPWHPKMETRLKRAWLAVLATVLASSWVLATDWPQIGGPDRNNISTETGLLDKWPADGPQVLWKLPLGVGFGAAAVRDGEVYVLDRVGTEKDVLRCLELHSGKELWTVEYEAPGKASFPGSRSVPTVTDKYVFSVGPFGHLQCVDRKTHMAVWSTNVIGPKPGGLPWAIAQSPSVFEDIVVTSGPGMPGMTAYRQSDGKVVWETKGIPGMAFSSPVLMELLGKQQFVMTTGENAWGVDPKDGAVLWKMSGYRCGIQIPHPMKVSDSRVLITGGYKAGSVMFELSKAAEGDGYAAKELWRIAEGSQIHQPLLVEGAIYLNGNTNDSPRQGLTCVDAEKGEVLWASNDPPLDRGNIIFADGRLYAMGATGTLHMVQPDKQGMKVLQSSAQLKGKEIWAPMALSDGILVIRDQGEMRALKLKD